MHNETDSKILAGLAAVPELLAAVQRLHERLDSIEKKLDRPDVPAPVKKRVLRLKEVADELNLSPSGVYRLIYKDQLKPIRGLGRYAFLREDIDRFLSGKK